jgi:3-isopropylmalate/(R)-2-methylmalate dehydratase large subunit
MGRTAYVPYLHYLGWTRFGLLALTGSCVVQRGSQEVHAYCEGEGYADVFRAVGATFIEPCGACINAGPGVSRRPTDVTISAINRNFPGRSGPGQLYLASPFTVAASAMAGEIVEWTPQTEPAIV